MISITKAALCAGIAVLSVTNILCVAGIAEAADDIKLQQPKELNAFPENFGIRVGMTINQVKAVVPDISKYTEIEDRYNIAYPDNQGFTHYSFKPAKNLVLTPDKMLAVNNVRLFFDKASVLILMIIEKNDYSLAVDGSGDRLRNDSKDLFDFFVKQNGEPFAKYINYSDEIIKKYPNIFACLQSQLDVDHRQSAKKGSATPGEKQPVEPAPGEALTNRAQTEQKALTSTMKYLYGVDIGAKDKPSGISKEERGYLDEVAATCVFRNRAAINQGGEAVGLAQLDILPVDDQSAIMLYETFSRAAYRRYVEAMRTLSYGRQ